MAFDWSFAEGAARPGSSPGPPQVGERFQLRAVLGQGGMGTVYLAHDRELGRDVALKVLNVGRTHQAAMERVWREARAAGSLTHPGVVRVHDCLQVPAGPVVVCELVEGARPLSELLIAAQPLETRVEWVLEVARAVAHAHERGVVHRDLKPDNVLVDAAGRARVTDFGLAWQEGADSLTASGATLGTPHYMAPELLGLVEGAARDPRVDVWSLGVLLYQALCLRLPFQAATMLELMSRVARPPEAPSREVAGLPGALETVCLRALRLQPGQRFADAGELARALDVARASPPAPSSRRARVAVGVVLTGTLIAGGGALASRVGASDAPQAGPTASSAPASSPTTPAAPELAWSLREGQSWSTVYGYHCDEHGPGERWAAYDMRYDLVFRVERTDARSAQLRAEVHLVRFAMQDAGAAQPVLLLDTGQPRAAAVGARLPKRAAFTLRVGLPGGRVTLVRGASALRAEILEKASQTDRLLITPALIDLQDHIIALNLGALFGALPETTRRAADGWEARVEMRPADAYTLVARLRGRVSAPGALELELAQVMSAERPVIPASVGLSERLRWGEGRLESGRLSLQMRLAEGEGERDVRLDWILGEERPEPLASLVRPR
ncbi:MAG: protein kinase [Planctomycetota bacterium]